MRRSRGRGNSGHSNSGPSSGHSNPSGGNHGGGSRRPGIPNRHQVFDSNGPDVRIRGNAAQVYEKYQALARDAQTSGDRVKLENYLQHAEHYYRILLAINEAMGEAGPPRNRNGAPQGEGYADGDAQPDMPPSMSAMSPMTNDPAMMPQPSTVDIDLMTPPPEAAVA